MTLSLNGKTAVITGGTSGIGFAIARKLLENGADVILLGTNPQKGEQALKDLEGISSMHPPKFFSVDTSQTEQVETLFQSIPKVDILVNCAGITKDGLLMKMSEEDWDRVLDVNAKSCFNTCKAVIRSMLKARSGVILNISSVIGLTGNAGQFNYAASKGAIISMTKALAQEVAGRKIRVNCIAPGFISTPMTDALTEEQRDAILKRIPLGRFGLPEEVANVALFLVSQLADYITGQVITVDGGMVM